MRKDLICFNLRPDEASGQSHQCQMSVGLYQNARQTMGELRDLLRYSGLSWEFIEREIERANRKLTGLDRAMDAMDPYTTGPGRSLKDLPRNVW